MLCNLLRGNRMKNKRIHVYKKTNGFTLVELIIVLVIFAILAAFTIPAMLGFVGNSKEKLCESARSDCLRYYQTQATEKLPITREEAIPILAKAIQNSYGDATVENNVAKGVCPAGGEYNLAECRFELENGYYRLKEVPCSVHHDKDSSRPNLDATKTLADKILEGLTWQWDTQSKFISELYNENGGTLKSVDEIDLKNIFGEDWSSELYQKPENLYWRPLAMKIGDKTTYITYASSKNSSDQAEWKGFMVEVNGVYYKSTKKSHDGKVDPSVVAGKTQFTDDAALSDWLVNQGFEKVE